MRAPTASTTARPISGSLASDETGSNRVRPGTEQP